MPPSGYSNVQSDSIVGFLVSCSHALKSEGLQKKLDPCSALKAECTNIVKAFNLYSDNAIGKAVLKLTLTFYESILESRPIDYDEFDRVVQEKAFDTKGTILSIHVPDDNERPHNDMMQPIGHKAASG